MTQLLGLCGSLRKDSLNRKLLHEAARHYGARLTEGNLRLPLYDGDLEAEHGVPEDVMTLARQIKAAEAVVIAAPEYNKSISGVLKNALDWISRSGLAPWMDKPVAIMSATAGRAGGERTQFALRLCMMPFRPHLLMGPEVLVGTAADQFNADHRLTNVINEKALVDLMSALKAAAART